jgi:hypothetical protein
MKQYQWNAGQWVHWFRFDRPDTTSHPVYDTGPQRVWYPPVTIPVVIAEYMRASQNFDDDGMYLVDSLHIIMSYDAFFHSQITDPDPNGVDHLNDRVGFDGKLFSVNSFIPRGRVGSYFWTISVQCQDVAESIFAPYIVTS